jgi:prepilin-type N-terminal cleavage/methylation domain-containing protein
VAATSGEASRPRGGFTLVEVLVALVLGTLLVGIVLQFVVGQSRFAATQAGREEVQQNLRGALEIVGSELRGTVASGITLADDQAIEFLSARRWGIVCGTAAGTQTTVIFPANVPAPAPPTGSAAVLMVFNETTSAWLPAAGANPATITAAQAVPATGAPCNGVGTEGPVVAFQLTGANHPAGTAGFRVVVGERVRYDLGSVGGSRWLRRSNGLVGTQFTMQPLAGPVDVDAVRFSYFAGAPGAAPAPIGAPGFGAPGAQLRMVRFVVRTTSRQATGLTHSKQDSVTVQIRN